MRYFDESKRREISLFESNLIKKFKNFLIKKFKNFFILN
jgi:hypothetical protein